MTLTLGKGIGSAEGRNGSAGDTEAAKDEPLISSTNRSTLSPLAHLDFPLGGCFRLDPAMGESGAFGNRPVATEEPTTPAPAPASAGVDERDSSSPESSRRRENGGLRSKGPALRTGSADRNGGGVFAIPLPAVPPPPPPPGAPLDDEALRMGSPINAFSLTNSDWLRIGPAFFLNAGSSPVAGSGAGDFTPPRG